jgi:BMFP domain-containing protein YqiC
MAFLFVSRFVGFLASRIDTIARKPDHDEARRPLRRNNTGLEWHGPDRHCLGCRPFRSRPEIPTMTQTSNRFFDEIGRLMNDAAGAAQGVKREVDAVVRNQAEKILRDLDIVKREEFEAVKDMARLAREENEALKARIAVLEAKLGVAAPDSGSPKTGG